MIAPASVRIARVSKYRCDRAKARLPSVRAAISRRPAMTNSASDALNSSLSGDFSVFLLYTMRRVDCRRCGTVVVEEVPWGDGKRTLTKVYMLFLARWARRLSWKETAAAFLSHRWAPPFCAQRRDAQHALGEWIHDAWQAAFDTTDWLVHHTSKMTPLVEP